MRHGSHHKPQEFVIVQGGAQARAMERGMVNVKRLQSVLFKLEVLSLQVPGF
jgi:hypothetical protein